MLLEGSYTAQIGRVQPTVAAGISANTDPNGVHEHVRCAETCLRGAFAMHYVKAYQGACVRIRCFL